MSAAAMLAALLAEDREEGREHEAEFRLTLADVFNLDPLLRDKIDAEGGHWFWTGARQKSGGGGGRRQGTYGRLKRKGVLWLAHRWLYFLAFGRIPDGYVVHHECGESLCINPAHLSAIPAEEHNAEHLEEQVEASREARRAQEAERLARRRAA